MESERVALTEHGKASLAHRFNVSTPFEKPLSKADNLHSVLANESCSSKALGSNCKRQMEGKKTLAVDFQQKSEFPGSRLSKSFGTR